MMICKLVPSITQRTVFYFCTVNNSSTDLQLAFGRHYKKNEMLKGHCTEKGTQVFRGRNQAVHNDHWRTPCNVGQAISLSSIGLGTHRGQATPDTDFKMFEVLTEGMKSGMVNCFDTDVMFRSGKSEKTINAALNYLTQQHQFSREQFFISTKCGYIMSDVDSELSEQKVRELIVNQGYVTKKDIYDESYCVHPNYINFSVQKSRLSLGVQTIDLLYLNNPYENLLYHVGTNGVRNKFIAAFERLQELRQENKIRNYGIASFQALRSSPDNRAFHGPLIQALKVAREVGGDNHGLRFVLLPISVGMPEALLDWQADAQGNHVSIFELAKSQGFNVNICSPLFHGQCAEIPFKTTLLDYLSSNCAKHMELTRSIPKPNLVSAFFGTLQKAHAIETLEPISHPCLTKQQWRQILPIPQK